MPLLTRPRFILAERTIDRYIHTRSRPDRQHYILFDWVGPSGQGGESFCFFARTHFLACEGVAGGSQQSGGQIIFCCLGTLPCVRRYSWWVPAVRGADHCFCPDALPCVRRCSWWVPAVRGKRFFAKYSGPSGGSQLSGGGIIIFTVIRRHFLAAAVDPAVSLSTYSPRPMEVVP